MIYSPPPFTFWRSRMKARAAKWRAHGIGSKPPSKMKPRGAHKMIDPSIAITRHRPEFLGTICNPACHSFCRTGDGRLFCLREEGASQDGETLATIHAPLSKGERMRPSEKCKKTVASSRVKYAWDYEGGD